MAASWVRPVVPKQWLACPPHLSATSLGLRASASPGGGGAVPESRGGGPARGGGLSREGAPGASFREASLQRGPRYPVHGVDGLWSSVRVTDGEVCTFAANDK